MLCPLVVRSCLSKRWVCWKTLSVHKCKKGVRLLVSGFRNCVCDSWCVYTERCVLLIWCGNCVCCWLPWASDATGLCWVLANLCGRSTGKLTSLQEIRVRSLYCNASQRISPDLATQIHLNIAFVLCEIINPNQIPSWTRQVNLEQPFGIHTCYIFPD